MSAPVRFLGIELKALVSASCFVWVLPGSFTSKLGKFAKAASRESIIMIPPGKHQPDVMQKMEAWAIVSRMMGPGRVELARAISEQMLSGPLNQDSYWLWGLRVDPSAAGKGYAGALIKQVTDLADADNKACYVVGSSEKIVKTFERRGFAVLSRSENFPYWFMLRSARE